MRQLYQKRKLEREKEIHWQNEHWEFWGSCIESELNFSARHSDISIFCLMMSVITLHRVRNFECEPFTAMPIWIMVWKWIFFFVVAKLHINNFGFFGLTALVTVVSYQIESFSSKWELPSLLSPSFLTQGSMEAMKAALILVGHYSTILSDWSTNRRRVSWYSMFGIVCKKRQCIEKIAKGKKYFTTLRKL